MSGITNPEECVLDTSNPQDAAFENFGSDSYEMPNVQDMPQLRNACEAEGCLGCMPKKGRRGKTSFLTMQHDVPETTPSHEVPQTNPSYADTTPVTLGIHIEHTKIKSRFNVRNICCESEVHLIERIITPLPGVDSVSVNSFQKMCVVAHCSPCCTTPESILGKLNNAGLGASLLGQGGEEINPPPMNFRDWCHRHARMFVVLCGGICMAASALSELAQLHASGFLIAAILIGIPCILWESCAALKLGQIDVTLLVAIAVFAAAWHGELFDAALVVLLFNTAKIIEAAATRHVAHALRSVMQLQATRTVQLAKDGRSVQVSELQSGDVIALRPGEECPADGRVVAGAASCSEAAITGEARPFEKRTDSQVSSGTLILNGYIEVELAKASSDHIDEIEARVQDAQTKRTARQMLIGRFAHVWTPGILVVSLLTSMLPPLLGGDWEEWRHRAVVLLLIACPCAIVIGAPLATTCAIAAAASNGVLIKRPETVERLPSISAVGLDKTGTLTKGEMSVLSIDDLSESIQWEQAEALKAAAALEMKSAHPIAAAIVSKALGCVADAYESIDLAPVKKFRSLPGVGVQGHVVQSSGQTVKVLLGNRKALDMVSADAAAHERFAEFQKVHVNDTTVALIIDGTLQFGLALNDTLRPDAERLVRELKSLALRPCMLTGDSESAGLHMSTCVGLDVEMSCCSMNPEQKVEWVEQQQAAGQKTLMLGDGMNDASALAVADVGVAIGETGAALSAQSADVVMMTEKLHKLSQCIVMCKYAVRIECLNIGIPCFIKLMQGCYALFGELDLWVAIVTDLGTLLLVLALGVSILSKRFWREEEALLLSHTGKAVQRGYEEFV